MALPVSQKAKDAGRIAGPIIINNCIEVDLVWNIATAKVVKNVLHGQVAAGFSATAAIAQAVYAAIIASGQWTAYKAYVNAGASFAGVYLRDLRPPGGFPLVLSTGAATPGTGAGLALAPGVAACVKQSTAAAGRSNRGRIYLPGLDSTAMNLNTGQFLAAFQTAAQNFIAEVGTALAASGITMSIANPARAAYVGRTGRIFGARAANVINVTTSTMTSLTPRSQRRRNYAA